jgi:TrkA-C domain
MTSLILVLAVIALSLLVTRVAAIMLSLTGMARESARFQARSAFTGVGFTTGEAEAVTRHPIRRRIVLVLMLLGSAGVVTAVASLFVSFGGGSGGQKATRALVLLGGVVLLLLLSRSRLLDRLLARVTARLMRASGLDVRDYAGLLQLEGGYRVGELEVEEGDWVAGLALGELRLRDEGVVVLGVHRAGAEYVGVPGKNTVIQPGDTLVVYGPEARLQELDVRGRGAAGDRAHAAAAGR